MDDLVLGVFIACCVLVVIALLGLAIACSRPYSCVRTAVCLLYYVTSLPAAVALGFAVTFCLAFRSEAEQIVRRWLCLLLTEPQHMNGARAPRGGRRCGLSVGHSCRDDATRLRGAAACRPLCRLACDRPRRHRASHAQRHQLRTATRRRRPVRCRGRRCTLVRTAQSTRTRPARPRRLRARHELPWPTRASRAGASCCRGGCTVCWRC